MKKYLSVLVLLALLPARSFPKNKQDVKCKKQSVPFVVDGKTGEWNTDSLQFDSKTGFAYALSNDGQNLYIQLKMLNVTVQRKALLTGLTVWIDPRGKGKHVLGIVYPRGRKHPPSGNRQNYPGHSQAMQHRSAANKGLTPEQVRMFNERFAKEIPQLKGFEKSELPGGQGIRVKLQMDSLGHVVYEAKIPLKAIFAGPGAYLTKAEPFSILIETGYLQLDMSRMQGRGMGGGNPGGGGHMGGGRMGGGQGPGPSRMAMMQNMTEPSRLKLKSVTLFQIK